MKKTACFLLAAWLTLMTLTACQDPPSPPQPGESASGDPIPGESGQSPADPDTSPDGETTVPPMEEVPMESIQTYTNPLLTAVSEQAWPDYGFGDPFVMRHNGIYYLYVSTKDGCVGIKCWSSPDLVNWHYEGFCSNHPVTRGAYAPEVYYYNGYFYMYTSPAGNGHYVLRSTSPTKGFEPITGNMGMSIDGSVFIDKNGSWYFYTAGGGSMMAYEMTSPSTMKGGRPLQEVSVNGGWTEGPMVVYHDGRYYMTYTGNHVLSRSYRIRYAVSGTSPLAFRGRVPNDPLLVSTAEAVYGIGHSSTVKGPDLDSYYLVYHSLVNTVPNRNMNIDRIVFDGDTMQILGPTVAPQQAPDLPDVYHRFEAGASLKGWSLEGGFGTGKAGVTLRADSRLISSHIFPGDFTAEYNLLSIGEGGQAGALFGYTDSENFGSCVFDPARQKVVISITVAGQTTVTEADTVRSFGEDTRFDCLQSLQIERSGSTYTFYMNDRLLCTVTDSPLAGGSIGYTARGAQATFGFIGGTAGVGGRASADDFKSVSAQNGLIPAREYTEGSLDTVTVGGRTAVMARSGDTLTYRILAADDGQYDLSLLYSGQGTVTVSVDGQTVREIPLSKSNALSTAVARGISLGKGQHTLSVTLIEGEVGLTELALLLSAPVPVGEVALDGAVYTDGSWQGGRDGMTLAGRTGTGKRLYGNPHMGDYTVEVKVTPETSPNCGLLVRATAPGAPNFMHQAPTEEEALDGTDWIKGYFIGLTEGGVIIGKQSYGYEQVAYAEGSFPAGSTYTLKAVCEGARIRVYVDGKLCLDYVDPAPYLWGMAGIRGYRCEACFEGLRFSENQG